MTILTSKPESRVRREKPASPHTIPRAFLALPLHCRKPVEPGRLLQCWSTLTREIYSTLLFVSSGARHTDCLAKVSMQIAPAESALIPITPRYRHRLRFDSNKVPLLWQVYRFITSMGSPSENHHCPLKCHAYKPRRPHANPCHKADTWDSATTQAPSSAATPSPV